MMADVDEGLFSGCVDADTEKNIKKKKGKKMEARKTLKMKINQIRECLKVMGQEKKLLILKVK